MVTAVTAPTEEPEAETGDVVVLRQDNDGNPVGGSCFMIVADDNSVVADEVCDEDGDVADDGRTGFFDVPDGTWWIVETRSPEGYEAASPTQFSVQPGSTGRCRGSQRGERRRRTDPGADRGTRERRVPHGRAHRGTATDRGAHGSTRRNWQPPGRSLRPADGALVGGACWQLIQDDNVVAEACDLEGTADRFPLNGKVGLYDVPVGDYQLRHVAGARRLPGTR